MKTRDFETIDGNELNEVIALFPITPASPMGDQRLKNGPEEKETS